MLPISFLQNIFASQYSFLPPNDFLLTKNSPKILLAKFPPQKNLHLQNMLPKISSQENFFQKKFVPHFAPLIFIQKHLLPRVFPPKNLLPNIFALHISSHNEILLTNILPKYFCWRNFLLTRISPPNLGPQNFLSRKFALKRNCSPFCPPPFFFIQKNLLPKYYLPKFAAKHFCSPYYFSQKFASQILLPKNLCCPNHFVEQLWHLINTGAVAGYSAVPAALLLNFCHLLKNCD